jgi:putative transposase
MLDRQNQDLSVKRQADLLEVSRTSVYYVPAIKEDEDIPLMHRIDEIYTRWPHYGHRRIRSVLQNEGVVISKKKTCQLMRRMGLAGLCPGPNLSKRNLKEAIHPYLLRGVKATHPNHVWGIDITYIRMQGSFMYLVAIIDWYSRYLVSWELSQSLERSFVLRAINKAFCVGKPEIFNSDQGSHFTSNDYINLLQKNEVKISMDGKGRATDNAITERFFRSLKWEKLYYHTYTTPQMVYKDVRSYIDEYNSTRPHQSLGYASPVQFYHQGEQKTG